MAGIRFFPADATEQRQLLQRLLCWSDRDPAVSVGWKPSFGPHGMVELPASICAEGYGPLLLKPGATAVPCDAAATTWTYVSVNPGDTAPLTFPSCLAVPTLPTPAGLAATPGNAQVGLTWTAVPEATGYSVQYRTGAGAWTAQAATGTSATVTGLTNGTAYEFQVKATGDGMPPDSEWSASVNATPTA